MRLIHWRPSSITSLHRPPSTPERGEAGLRLQTTALVNEAYLRLVDYKRMRWENRAHFAGFRAADAADSADHARRHNPKRGRF